MLPPRSLATAITGDNAPANAAAGDLWYRTSDGRLYVYYDDGSTAQWVDANPNLPPASDTFERNGTDVTLVNSGTTLALGRLVRKRVCMLSTIKVDQQEKF